MPLNFNSAFVSTVLGQQVGQQVGGWMDGWGQLKIMKAKKSTLFE